MADPAAVDQFIQITGADATTASFFLSAANGDCDAAVSTYFESDGMIPTAAEAPHLPRPSVPTAASLPPPPGLPVAPAAPSAPQGARPSSSAAANSPRPPARASSRPRSNQRFATLGSLERERDDDEKGYYAGGERSGQMIQDPRNRNENRDPGTSHNDDDAAGDPSTGLVNAILNRARTRAPRPDAEREHFEGPQRFAGAGYRLGETEGRVDRPTIIGRRNVTRVLTFYANGFRIDDGPLRRLDDPANEAFLEDVNRGVVPREMEEPDVGDVSITLIDKKTEEYVEDSRPIVPFSGGGQRLDGSAAPSLHNHNSSQPPASQQPVDSAAAESVLNVDESRPTTRVQIRLSDGTRLVARMNVDNTVGQLRQFVRASRPAINEFTLATTFPKTVLNDDSKTIKDAGLMGAVVVQTLS